MAYQVDPKRVDFKKENKWLVPVGVSNHHVHLSAEHIEALFGKGYQLTPFKDLSQPGQYAAKEKVNVVGAKGVIQNVRILGPARKETQVELSQTEARQIGIDAPLRDSGDLDGTPGCILVGPKGPLIIEKGCIVAKIHVHFHPSDAEKLGIQDKDKISILMKGAKVVCYHDVLARVGKDMKLDFHLDTDEANAAMVKTGDVGLIQHKEMVVKDNYGNIIECKADNVKFVQGKKPSDYVTQEGIRLLRTVFEYPASAQRDITEKMLNPEKLDPHKFYLFTALSDDKVIGIATFYYLSDEKLGYLEHIGIIPEYRNRGIGSFFYHKLIAFLEEEHPEIEGIFMEVRKTDEELDNRKEFFLNLGAIPVDTSFYPNEKFKAMEGLLLMYRPLVAIAAFNTGTVERAFKNLSKVM
ncbi:MAG: phosphate propanoyltransferase [Clostridia bacterium]|jgi:propanediol utilization protein/N-acetylglutamate synthase-like GNAT family acetyltransferase|nr:phosphate propanoyltransferase [Clostridia bacterium]